MQKIVRRESALLELILKCYTLTNKRSEIFNLSMRDVKVLYFLNDQVPSYSITVGDLSRNLELTMPATSKILKTLESRGYISRVASKEDRRTIMVSITDLGIKCFNEYKMEICREIQSIITYMGIEKIDSFLPLLRDFISAVEYSI